MGDRSGTIFIRRSLTFTSASLQIRFIHRKAISWNTTGSDLALLFFPSEFIRLLHTGRFAQWINLNLKLKENSFMNNVFRRIIGGKTILLLK